MVVRKTLKEQEEQLNNLSEAVQAQLYDHGVDIARLNSLQFEAESLLRKLERKQRNIEQLVNLGFIFLAFTALGITIGFLNLIIDVYTFINTKF